MNDIQADPRLAPIVRRMSSTSTLSSSQSSQEPALDLRPERPNPFITPTVQEHSEPGNNLAPIVLVSASAAVGKSYLAKYIAAETKSPLWDLSKESTTVGTNYFHGTLVKAFGGAGFARAAAELESGGATLVIDALDEALVAATLRGFIEAISDLARLVGSGHGSVAKAILFGRPESLDYVALAMDEAGVDWQRLKIEFFEKDAALEFIHIVAKNTDPDNYSFEAVDSYARAVVKLVEEAVEKALPNGADSHLETVSFMGYAPVLDAIGRMAVGPGPTPPVVGEGADGDLAVWDLLSTVLERILEREVEKIQNGAPADLQAALQECFSPDMQLRFLLCRDLSEVQLPLPDTFSAAEREAVRERIEYQMSDHAFRRGGRINSDTSVFDAFANVAIRDYCASRALASGRSSMYSAAIDYYSFPGKLRSPLLARFLMSLGRTSATATLPISAAGVVLDSASLVLGDRAFDIVVEERKVRSEPTGTQVTMTAYENNMTLGNVRFVGDEHFPVSQYARSTTILLPSRTVVIGDGSREVELGPNCTISCSRFISHALSIRVAPEGSSILEANEIVGSTRRISARNDQLKLFVNKSAAPWDHFTVGKKSPTPATSTAQFVADALALRRYVRWFVFRRGGTKYHYPRKPIDDLLNKALLSRDWHEFLLEKGHLESTYVSYRLRLNLDLQRLMNVDTSYTDLRTLVSDFQSWGDES